MVELNDAQASTIAAYLAQYFPEDASRRPNLIAGDTEIEIIKWTVPTLGQRSRDPIEAPDGSTWWTGMRASLTGRLDPDTGDLTEIPVEPRPNGIKVDSQGTVWVAFNGTNKIGALDPDRMAIRYYEVPDERARIRRLDLDSQDIVWFVNSTLGKIGKLHPETGQITQWDSPIGPRSHPYSMAVINDVICYKESGMRPDALVRFNPATEAFQSWALPSGVGIMRNTWVTEAGDLLKYQSSSNQVGLVKIS